MSKLIPSKFSQNLLGSLKLLGAPFSTKFASSISRHSSRPSKWNPRSGCFGVVATLVFLSARGLSINAEPLNYTSIYEASKLPEEGNSQWVRTGDSEATAHISENGKLEVSTLEASTLVNYWVLGKLEGQPVGAASEWGTNTGTIDFRVLIDSAISAEEPEGAQGFWIQVSDQAGRCWNFFIGKSAIYATDIVTGQIRTVDTESVGLNTGNFNDYRIAIDAGVASLYVNDSQEPIFSRIPGVEISGRTALMFGDSSSFQSSSYLLEFIKWSNVAAEFYPPL